MNGCGEIPLFSEKTSQWPEFSEKNIWFFLPLSKIKFDPPQHGKNALVLTF